MAFSPQFLKLGTVRLGVNQRHFWPAARFCEQSLTETQPCSLISVFAVAAFKSTMMAELKCWDRDHTAHKAQSIYYLTLCKAIAVFQPWLRIGDLFLLPAINISLLYISLYIKHCFICIS